MNYGFNTNELTLDLLRPVFIEQLLQQVTFYDTKTPLHLVYVLVKLQTSSIKQRRLFIQQHIALIIQALLEAEQEWVLHQAAQQEPDPIKGAERRNGTRLVEFTTKQYGTFQVAYPRNRNKTFKSQIINPRKLKNPFTLDHVVEYLIDLCSLAQTLDKLIYTLNQCFKAEINGFILTKFLIRIAPLMRHWNPQKLHKSYIHGACQRIKVECHFNDQIVPYYIHLMMGTNELREQQVLHLSASYDDNEQVWEEILQKLTKNITYITKIYTYHVGDKPTSIVDLENSNHEKAVITIDEAYTKSTTFTALTHMDSFHQALKKIFNYSYYFYYD